VARVSGSARTGVRERGVPRDADLGGDRVDGCPFVNAVAELKEPRHAANKIALAFKEHDLAWRLGMGLTAGMVQMSFALRRPLVRVDGR
jgi:hypothetical protein